MTKIWIRCNGDTIVVNRTSLTDNKKNKIFICVHGNVRFNIRRIKSEFRRNPMMEKSAYNGPNENFQIDTSKSVGIIPHELVGVDILDEKRLVNGFVQSVSVWGVIFGQRELIEIRLERKRLKLNGDERGCQELVGKLPIRPSLRYKKRGRGRIMRGTTKGPRYKYLFGTQ